MLTNEEQVELNQLGRKRWNWTGILILGVVLLVAGVASAATGGSSGGILIGVVVAIVGAVMRGKMSDRIKLIEARLQDRVS